MELTQKHLHYNISLSEGETLKILVNDNEVFNETVGTGFTCLAMLQYNEEKL